MSSTSQTFHDLVIAPEKTFPALGTRTKAYLVMYAVPLIIFVSLMGPAFFYGYTLMLFTTPVVFIALYGFSIYASYNEYRVPKKLKVASEVALPEVLIDYFKKQYPSASVPMMLSKDRTHWVAYGHINKERMARAMTFVEYNLMDPPPKLTHYFIDNSHRVKHQYLIIEDPDAELFRITDNPPHDSVYYPVTVFDKEEEK